MKVEVLLTSFLFVLSVLALPLQAEIKHLDLEKDLIDVADNPVHFDKLGEGGLKMDLEKYKDSTDTGWLDIDTDKVPDFTEASRIAVTLDICLSALVGDNSTFRVNLNTMFLSPGTETDGAVYALEVNSGGDVTLYSGRVFAAGNAPVSPVEIGSVGSGVPFQLTCEYLVLSGSSIRQDFYLNGTLLESRVFQNCTIAKNPFLTFNYTAVPKEANDGKFLEFVNPGNNYVTLKDIQYGFADAPVPEPSVAGMALAALGLSACRRYRRK